MKSVNVVGTVGIPACYGGWETLVENIVKCRSTEVEYTVYCSSKAYSTKKNMHSGARLVYLPLSANGISSIFYDILSLIHTLFKRPDNVLVLGVSGCIFLPIFRFLSKTKIIVNVDGIEWKRDKWSGFAKLFLKFSEAMAVKYSDVVIADNQGISDYLLAEYGVKANVIAYGGEHALISTLENNDVDRTGYFFTVCRIEPENNVKTILDAFSKTKVNYKIVGNWDSSDYGRKLKSMYTNFENIEVIDPVYDLSVLFEYRKNCIGYVHGHSVGGTNPSLVEIMHFGKQIYAFDCVFNRFTTEDQAVYFSNSDELVNLITDNSFSSNNPKMKDIAVKRYSWNVVAEQYESVYEEI